MGKDLINSLKAYLYDRTGSPLTGSFVVSWLIINYKLILLLLSSTPYLKKIDFINVLYPTFTISIILLFIAPFVSSFVYIFIYPYIEKLFYERFIHFKYEKKKLKNQIEDKQQLSLNESIALRKKIREIELEENKFIKDFENDKKLQEETIDTLIKENSDLSAIIDELQREIKLLKNSKKTKSSLEKLEEDDQLIIKSIASGFKKKREVADELGLTEMYVGARLDKLINEGFIAVNVNGSHFSTEKSRAYLLDNGLIQREEIPF